MNLKLTQQYFRIYVKKITFIAIFLFFSLQVAFNAYYSDDGVAPDESHHVGTSILWSNAKDFTVPDSTWAIGHGPLNQFPYLYHMTLGFWYKLKPDSLSDFWWLRIPNIFIASLSFFIGYLFLRKTKLPWIGQVLSLFFLSNLLMYVYLAGMVTYDNGTNLLAILGFLGLIYAAEKKSLFSFALILIACLVGNLIKIVFLPLSVAFLVAGFVSCYKKVFIEQNWRDFFSRKRNWALVLIVFGLTVANIRLYGVNYYRFGEIYPSCETVYGTQTCVKVHNAISIREKQLTEKIQENPIKIGLIEYVEKYYEVAEITALGIVGFDALAPIKERGEMDRARVAGIIWILGFFTALSFSSEFRRDKTLWVIFSVSAFYGLSLFVTSWNEFHKTGLMAPVHGRYWFPILIPMLYVFHRALFAWKNKAYTRVMASLLLLLYSGIGLNVQFGHRHRIELMRIFPKTRQASILCSHLETCESTSMRQ